MIMFKFIHAADIHLDSPLHKLDYYEGAPVNEIRQASRKAFKNLVDLAIAEEVAFILLAGDLYDGDWKDYNTGLYFVSQMRKLREAQIPVFIIAGNHDAASTITKNLRLPDGVEIFPSNSPKTIKLENLNVAIHGQSFSSPSIKKDLSANYPLALTNYFNIGMLHTCATGKEGHEPYAPCTIEGLISKGYDYWALGHVHNHEILKDDPFIVFPGNIQGRHIRETETKGCVMVTVEDDERPSIEFKPLDVIRWFISNVDASGAESGYEIIDQFKVKLEKLLDQNPGIPIITRVLISGDTIAHNELVSDIERWTNEIRSAALDISGETIWIEKVRFNTQVPITDEDLKITDGAIGELVTRFDELLSNPDSLIALAKKELSSLETKLPIEFKDGVDAIVFSDVKWLGNLIDQVKPMLLKRMIRKGESE